MAKLAPTYSRYLDFKNSADPLLKNGFIYYKFINVMSKIYSLSKARRFPIFNAGNKLEIVNHQI